MAKGFSSRILVFEFEDETYTCEIDNEKMHVLDKVAQGLPLTMPQQGSFDYERVHTGTHNVVADLFGKNAYAEIFGDRPVSLLDDLDVLSALNQCVAKFMNERISEALSFYPIVQTEQPEA